MKSTRQAEQQETNSSDSSSMSIQRLLLQRAKERASPLKWDIYSVILSYSTLVAVIIMSLQDVNVLITVLVAVLVLGSVLLSGW